MCRRSPRPEPRAMPLTWLIVTIALVLSVPTLYVRYELAGPVLRYAYPYLSFYGAAFLVLGVLILAQVLNVALPRWVRVGTRLGLLATLSLWAFQTAFLPGVVTGEVLHLTLIIGFAVAGFRPEWEPVLMDLVVGAVLLQSGGLMWLRPTYFPADIYGHLPPVFPLFLVAGGFLVLPVYARAPRSFQILRRVLAAVPILWFGLQWGRVSNWLGVALYVAFGYFLLVQALAHWYSWSPALLSLRQRVMGLVMASCVLPLFVLGAVAMGRVEVLERAEATTITTTAVDRSVDRIDGMHIKAGVPIPELNALVDVTESHAQTQVVPLDSLPKAWPQVRRGSLETRWPTDDLRLVAFTRRPDLGVAVVASMSVADAYHDIGAVAALILVGILVIGALAGAVSLFLARRVTDQLTQVRAAAVNLGQTVLGWTKPLPTTQDEAADLAEIVDEMAHTIQINTHQIKQQNMQLREQTAALERQTSLLIIREQRLQGLGHLGQLALSGADVFEIHTQAIDLVAAGLDVTPEEAAALIPGPGPMLATDDTPQLDAEARSFLQSVSHVLMTAANRRHMEEALASANDQTTAILESITDAFFTLDGEWRFVYVNHQAENTFNRKRTELLGRVIWDVFPKVRDQLFHHLQTAMHSQQALHFDSYYAYIDRWFESHAYPAPVGISVYFRDITERHLTEQRLQEEMAQRTLEHRRLTVVMESMPVGVILADAQGKALIANDAAAELMGLDGLQLPDSMNGNGPREVLVKGPDGQSKSVLLSAEPVHDDDGQLVNVVHTAIDITDRTRMEAELRASEQLLLQQNAILQLIARGAPVQEVLAAIIQFVEAHCEGAAAAMEMLDPGRVALRYTLAPHLPEGYRQAAPLTPVGPASASSGTAVFRGEPVISPDLAADPAWAERGAIARSCGIGACWAFPVRTAQIEIMGALSVYTQEARGPSPAEARLLVAASTLAGIAVERNRVEEARILKLQSLIDQMGEGVLALDETGRVLAINPAAARMLRLPTDPGAIALSDTELPPELIDLIGRAARADVSESNRLIFRRGDQDLEAYVSTVAARWGPHHGAIALLHDITAEAQFRRLQESFVANVSHELRGPLTSLSAAVEAIVDGMVPEDQQMRYLRRILAELGRLQRISCDLVDLSRLDAGALELRREPFFISDLCNSVAEKFRDRCEGAGVDLLVDPSALRVVADYDRAEQVVTNLVENAVKFTLPGGYIRLSAVPEGERVRILVADTGVGIPREHLPYIWERFYQVDAARTLTPSRGAGLGLSIVRQLVQGMGGQVDMASEVGRGTTVSFTLPTA